MILQLLSFGEYANSNESEDFSFKPFNADFVAYRSGSDVGTAKLNLTHIKDDTYKLTYHSKLSKFLLSDKRLEETQFIITNKKSLVPLKYEYYRSGTGPNKRLNIVFNDKRKTVEINDESTIDWDGELDNQLFRIDLAKKLADGQTNVSYDFFNYRGEKRHYELEYVKTEALVLPYGQVKAMKVKINRETRKRVTYAWFAPSLNYNLVRLQQFKKGKEQGDIQLSKFKYL